MYSISQYLFLSGLGVCPLSPHTQSKMSSRSNSDSKQYHWCLQFKHVCPECLACIHYLGGAQTSYQLGWIFVQVPAGASHSLRVTQIMAWYAIQDNFHLDIVFSIFQVAVLSPHGFQCPRLWGGHIPAWTYFVYGWSHLVRLRLLFTSIPWSWECFQPSSFHLSQLPCSQGRVVLQSLWHSRCNWWRKTWAIWRHASAEFSSLPSRGELDLRVPLWIWHLLFPV